MIKYSVAEFARLISVEKRSVQRWIGNGKLVPCQDAFLTKFFTPQHFLETCVKKVMADRGIGIPDDALAEITNPSEASLSTPSVKKVKETLPVEKGLPSQVVKKGPKPAADTRKDWTTPEQLADMAPGLMVREIPPMVGLTDDARALWRLTLRSLIHLGEFQAAGLPILRDFCATSAQVQDMEWELGKDYFLFDGKRNPRRAALDQSRTTARSRANELQLTPKARKTILDKVASSAVSASTEDADWTKALQ